MPRVTPAFVIATALATTACSAPDWAAQGILRPWRRPVETVPQMAHETVAFESDGLRLEGWHFPTPAPARGVIVYLHGIADNRRAGVGVAQRFVPRGFDVLTFDARAHGRSQGDTCSYGFFERRDVTRAIDAVRTERVVLFGSSLGAATALQAATDDPRVVAVIAQSSFSDLPAIVRDRTPWYLPDRFATAALARAGERAGFPPAAASPLAAAPRIHVPVLLIHGAEDNETPPDHSRRIYAALAGPKRLLLVPRAGHNDVLAREDVWREIEAFIDDLP